MATHRGTGIGGDSWRWSSHGLGADRGGRSSGAAPPAASNGPRLGSSLEGRLGRPGGAVGRWRRGAGNGPAQRSLRCSIGASGCYGGACSNTLGAKARFVATILFTLS